MKSVTKAETFQEKLRVMLFKKKYKDSEKQKKSEEKNKVNPLKKRTKDMLVLDRHN